MATDVSRVVGTAEFWRTMQEEHAAWSARNFAGSMGKPYRALLGFVEEVGEFVEALGEGDAEGMFDALGDALIFASDYCSKAGYDLAELVMLAQDSSADAAGDMLADVGRVCHHFLKDEQGIRTNEDHRSKVLAGLADVVSMMWDHYDDAKGTSMALDEVVRVTWEQVSKRDWVKDPVGGRSA